MKLKIAVVLAAIVTFAVVSEGTASAAGRRVRQEVQPAAPLGTPSTILPSPSEVLAVPAPGGGRLIGYALNVHPGARLARRLLSR